MKKIFFMLALTAIALVQNTFAQDSTTAKPTQILNAYLKLKDALVNSNSNAAAANAGQLVTIINGTSVQTVPENTRTSLLKDAFAISRSKEIELQRKSFASLSDHLFELAKTVKLSNAPLYQQYCPMKKASWLSNTQTIKNPYYGSAMLTCGSVKATL